MHRLLLVSAVAGVAIAAACTTADFTPAPEKDCTKVECDCEEDPSQPRCRGFSGAPDGGLDANTIADAITPPDATDAGEEAGDASNDAADAGDASDQ